MTGSREHGVGRAMTASLVHASASTFSLSADMAMTTSASSIAEVHPLHRDRSRPTQRLPERQIELPFDHRVEDGPIGLQIVHA